ncbi:MAG: MBL fold metallo-hydrolase [candidate division KSB1 bacterium]|nr:MBL fold metallo-hydrolase [candidate division KSB1 bacterium]MDZ7272979.1 MBL fold metallo-hydrolase [candidate division KSB1 bacterium]MDZ7285083.1 MBL fold metallo-hydrolase [candidate division KSB1 bacterium]MDZ7298115.1 MBL fold metallo-hydrolase [candidate division KSB1 bacterium]MDZ7309329.1 MBL fold metallo-hydrolase [candidate division KSB1 bacterium]
MQASIPNPCRPHLEKFVSGDHPESFAGEITAAGEALRPVISTGMTGARCRARKTPRFILAVLLAGALLSPATSQTDSAPFLVVLGIAQDAGVPQAGCNRECCSRAWHDASLRRKVTALGLVDPQTAACWLIEATPDFPEQLHTLLALAPAPATLAGIFLTHAHIGHYTGLMHLGREGMGARAIPVYAMPRLRAFLRTQGPWDQLVRLQNIRLHPLQHDSTIILNSRLQITPILVPHRDEYSETVGFRISGPRRRVLFIPDIDKWEKWERDIEDELARADVAYLDGTFYAVHEIPGRDLAEIPHPFIVESLARWHSLRRQDRARIKFIHLNHTNPALQAHSEAARTLQEAGMAVAREGERIEL